MRFLKDDKQNDELKDNFAYNFARGFAGVAVIVGALAIAYHYRHTIIELTGWYPPRPHAIRPAPLAPTPER